MASFLSMESAKSDEPSLDVYDDLDGEPCELVLELPRLVYLLVNLEPLVSPTPKLSTFLSTTVGLGGLDMVWYT